MNKGTSAVFGIYKTRTGVERAINTLKEAQFRSSDISILAPPSETFDDLAVKVESKAPEGLAAGAGTGAVVGGVLGWLVGIGALAIPGVGPFIAAGPIMAALAGVGVGGAVGGISGALIGLGLPEFEAKRYQGFIEEGGILLSVHVDDRDWARRAKEILDSTGAGDITTSREVDNEPSSFRGFRGREANRDLNRGSNDKTTGIF